MNREDTQFSTRGRFSGPPAWPFFVADGVLVVLAAALIHFSEPGNRPIGIAAFLLALGAVVFLMPYLLQWFGAYRNAEVRRREQLRENRGAGVLSAAQLQDFAERMEALLAPLGNAIEKVEALSAGMEKATAAMDHLKGQPDGNECMTRSVTQLMDPIIQERREVEKKLLDGIARVRRDVLALREISMETTTAEQDASAESSEEVRADGFADVADAGFAGESDPERDGRPNKTPETEPEKESELAPDPGLAATPDPASEPLPENPGGKGRRKAPVVRELGEGLFSTTTLLATAFIGAGNRLFVRGDGPGLSWDKGVPMQFLEIGRWGWTTAEAAGPVTLRIYRNDVEEDRSGEYCLKPGSSLEVRPEF